MRFLAKWWPALHFHGLFVVFMVYSSFSWPIHLFHGLFIVFIAHSSFSACKWYYRAHNLIVKYRWFIAHQGSPVYTPKDKDLWMLAKLSVQGADYFHSQLVEHLVKTHLLLEPFCVSKDRHLSERHPLHQLIKYHCRGISITSKIAFNYLLAENTFFHKVAPQGYIGAVNIVLKAFSQQTSWKDTDFMGNIKVNLTCPLKSLGFQKVGRASLGDVMAHSYRQL